MGETVIITNSINKTVFVSKLLPLCDNKCDWNKQKSVINCFTKIWQYLISLIYCIDKNKNIKSNGLKKNIWVNKFNVCIKELIFNISISNYLEKKHLLKFVRQNNHTEKAKILYFLNLVYFLSLVGL